MKGKTAVITGGASGIGKVLCKAFADEDAQVCTIDLAPNDYFVGDIADESVLTAFADKVIGERGTIDYLIHNAMLSRGGLDQCTYDDFNYVMKIGVTAPYYLTKLFMDAFNPGGSVVNISSTRYRMSQANTESYSAAKGGITALTHAMAISLAGKVRVNAVAPGWIDITGAPLTKEDHHQHPVGRVGVPEDIANAVLFLCSEKSAFINGQVITVDGGMSKLMVYHNDKGWTYGE